MIFYSIFGLLSIVCVQRTVFFVAEILQPSALSFPILYTLIASEIFFSNA